jgi:23S rRNA pseudouridine2605 synthase
MRIQKYLSEQGLASRREAEELMLAGLVSVNGEVIRDLGRQIDPLTDKVTLSARAQKTIDQKETVLIYKPRGVVSSNLRSEGKTIAQTFPNYKHLFPIGRLDKASEGLLILSNDGTLSKALTGDKHLIEKEYMVTVQEELTPHNIKLFERGINLSDGMTLPAKAQLVNPHKYTITLKEGRNHQIRRMAEELRLTVINLKRVRIGNIKIAKMKPGESRHLKPAEVQGLKDLN